MKISESHHLAYCTNVHRGKDWQETFDSLQQYTLKVKEKVSPDNPYGIGLRLSDLASRELSAPKTFANFKKWLDTNGCYVFTINGFIFGSFHGERIKEKVFQPDWTHPERVEYTNRLFDLLAQLVPEGMTGSVSTLPGSFKEFGAEEKVIHKNLWKCIEHVSAVSDKSGRCLELAMEPEPMGYFETTEETVRFFQKLRATVGDDELINKHLGVCYDTCHLAVEFEDPQKSLATLRDNNISICKFHISNALKVVKSEEAMQELQTFADDIYLHQVIERFDDGVLARYRDLSDALDMQHLMKDRNSDEWRIHYHIPLHSRPESLWDTTSDHIEGVLSVLNKQPDLCSHLEMETYTWDVFPSHLKSVSIVEQLEKEYAWFIKKWADIFYS